MDKKTIAWWSGGVTSAVACHLALQLFENVEIVFIDTFNEDDDTYRFKKDCEQWYGCEIKTISAIPEKYNKIQDVWIHFKSLNVGHGAICSSELKRAVREAYQKTVDFRYQVFGFDIKEGKRALGMKANYSKIRPVFPLLLYGLFKTECIDILQEAGITPPRTYLLGFNNNNCFKTGCVQGGIGYWQKMGREQPDKFDTMAAMEHYLTDLKGEPVTMLKDQSKEAAESGNTLVFLKPHPDYPELKDISMMEGREPKPLMECNGFCGTNDLLPRSSTESEINFQLPLFNDNGIK